ncbi:MAG TPA: hypothetical protein VLH56_11245 [Dissulfurispiraceae bacterium]|nr:hypothetical protein [Dissulfurispiraceae bacterium]
MTFLRDLEDILSLMGPDERERWEERMAIKCEGNPQRLETAAAEVMEEMKGGKQ